MLPYRPAVRSLGQLLQLSRLPHEAWQAAALDTAAAQAACALWALVANPASPAWAQRVGGDVNTLQVPGCCLGYCS